MNQNSIEIYVRSSPLGSNGIHWRKISEVGQPIEEPQVLKSRVVTKSNGKPGTINSLINDIKPSIILARYEGKILLEVTGLEASKERSAQLGRRITDVVLWVGDASEEVELQLRQLAALAILSIRDEDAHFLKVIRDAIQFEDLNDFRVDQAAIAGLSTQPEASSEISSLSIPDQSDASSWLSSEEITSNEHLHTLAQKIKRVSLPGADEKPTIVVVAEVKGEYLDYKGDVWKEEAPSQPEATIVRESEGGEDDAEKKTPSELPETKVVPPPRLLILGIVVTIAILIAATTAITTMRNHQETAPPATAPAPNSTTTSLTQEITTPKTSSPNPNL
jgi:hypothetical protein